MIAVNHALGQKIHGSDPFFGEATKNPPIRGDLNRRAAVRQSWRASSTPLILLPMNNELREFANYEIKNPPIQVPSTADRSGQKSDRKRLDRNLPNADGRRTPGRRK